MTVMVVGEGGRADLFQPWLDLWAHTGKTKSRLGRAGADY